MTVALAKRDASSGTLIETSCSPSTKATRWLAASAIGGTGAWLRTYSASVGVMYEALSTFRSVSELYGRAM